MKRFKLETGHVIKVDDCDAYLLRSRVYRANDDKDRPGKHIVSCKGDSALGAKVYLSHHIAGGPGIKAVIHKNGDDLDFTRANLVPMTAEQYDVWNGRRMRAAMLAKLLTS